jgi:mono/diheme cytochrome c family protein
MNSSMNQPASSAPREELSAKDPAMPIWLIIVFFLLLYWGAVYFDEHGGWFDPQIYTPYVSAEQLKTYQVGGTDIMEQGRRVYGATCFTCHGANAMGQAGTFPPLAGSDWVNEEQPGRMIRIVLQGFGGPGLKVGGQPFNTSSQMIAWKGLSDDDIAAVITFVRGNAEWGNHAGPVTPEQVAAVRKKIANKGNQIYTPTEIEAVNPAD